jgi:membrane protein implicated in regulation of membrane protease activity
MWVVLRDLFIFFIIACVIFPIMFVLFVPIAMVIAFAAIVVITICEISDWITERKRENATSNKVVRK